MSKATVRKLAILIGLVFLITVVVYPLIYSPEPATDAAEEIPSAVEVEP